MRYFVCVQVIIQKLWGWLTELLTGLVWLIELLDLTDLLIRITHMFS